MLKISKMSDYATLIASVLAEKNISMTASQLAAVTHVSMPTASKLLKIMTRANMVVSQLGANGGYRLAKKPNEISVLDILECVEGQFSLTECGHKPSDCAIEAYCRISMNWKIINETIKSTLNKITLMDLMHPEHLTPSLKVEMYE